jgi:hypothetical protein
VGCDHARRVANHHFRTGDHGNGGDRRFHGWKCVDHDRRLRGARTTCHRHDEGEKEKITYTFGW